MRTVRGMQFTLTFGISFSPADIMKLRVGYTHQQTQGPNREEEFQKKCVTRESKQLQAQQFPPSHGHRWQHFPVLLDCTTKIRHELKGRRTVKVPHCTWVISTLPHQEMHGHGHRSQGPLPFPTSAGVRYLSVFPQSHSP